MKLLKTSIFLLFFALIANAAQAQGWGARAGVNLSNISGNGAEMTNGMYAGIYKQFGIIPKLLYIQPEVQFSSQGFDTKTTDYDLNYIQVPIVARLYILKFLSVETGPQFGFLMSDKAKGPSTADFESFDPAWDFGLTFNLPLGLSIDGRIVTGMNDIIDNNNDSKTQVFQIGAGLKF